MNSANSRKSEGRSEEAEADDEEEDVEEEERRGEEAVGPSAEVNHKTTHSGSGNIRVFNIAMLNFEPSDSSKIVRTNFELVRARGSKLVLDIIYSSI